MEILKLCAAAVVCAAVCMILKKTAPEFSGAAAVLGVVLIFSNAAVGISQITDFALDLSEKVPSSESLTCIFKACAIMLVTEISSDICERSGEAVLAKALTVAGRVEILVIALPLFRILIDTAIKLCG